MTVEGSVVDSFGSSLRRCCYRRGVNSGTGFVQELIVGPKQPYRPSGVLVGGSSVVLMGSGVVVMVVAIC